MDRAAGHKEAELRPPQMINHKTAWHGTQALVRIVVRVETFLSMPTSRHLRGNVTNGPLREAPRNAKESNDRDHTQRVSLVVSFDGSSCSLAVQLEHTACLDRPSAKVYPGNPKQDARTTPRNTVLKHALPFAQASRLAWKPPHPSTRLVCGIPKCEWGCSAPCLCRNGAACPSACEHGCEHFRFFLFRAFGVRTAFNVRGRHVIPGLASAWIDV
jgi:hypothetical protein